MWVGQHHVDEYAKLLGQFGQKSSWRIYIYTIFDAGNITQPQKLSGVLERCPKFILTRPHG